MTLPFVCPLPVSAPELTNPHSDLPSSVLPFLTDPQWSLIHPVLPRPAARGRMPLDDRLILEAVLYKLLTGCPWYDLPENFPSHQTCYRRYNLWHRRGLLRRIYRLLLEDLRRRGGFDLHAALAAGQVAVRRPPFPGAPAIRLPPALEGWQRRTALILLVWGYRCANSRKPF